MKIKVTQKPYSEVQKLPKLKHIKPARQNPAIRALMRVLSQKELKDTNFTCTELGMEKLSKGEPALFLMNHSSFTDLQITAQLLGDRSYHIVMTNDGMVGKAGLMRMVGCIPTRKFIMDTTLVKDMKYVVDELHSSILMYPEASYSFDGTTTPLPDSLAKCVKLLKVPVVMIKTTGAFLRDPLYNNLQKRDVDVSATMTYLLSPEDIEKKTVEEINSLLQKEFEYNHFEDQIKNEIIIDEPFRADGLERVLYKCVKCGTEGRMVGKGVSITCEQCGDTHILHESGRLVNTSGETIHEMIPDWYKWQRKCVGDELATGDYHMDIDVDILMLVDYKSMYQVGSGHLSHDASGWHLTGCDGAIDFGMSAKTTYNLYADYFWYEIGDMVSIGDTRAQYYCFPQAHENMCVAKARLATEELYKMSRRA